MSTKKYRLTGIGSVVEFGKGGPLAKVNGGILEHRLNDDSNFSIVRAASPIGDDDLVTKKFLETRANVVVSGQIDGGAPPAVVNGAIYVVTTTGGAYNEGELYRGEGGSWVQVNVIDGLRITVTVPLSGGNIEFLADHVCQWDAGSSSWKDIGPAASITKVRKAERATITFGSSSPSAIGNQLPANAIVREAVVSVTQAFNDAAASLSIGNTGDNDKYMTTDEVDLTKVGLYSVDLLELLGSAEQVNAYLSAGTSTVGQASIVVEYDIQ